MKTIYHICCCLLFLSSSIHGQQYSYHYGIEGNAFAWNPAMAGKFNTQKFGAIYHQPWTGFEGSPQHLNAFFESPIFREQLSVGAILIGDKTNSIQGFESGIAVSYKLRFGYRSRNQLILGIGFRYQNLRAKLDDPTVNNPADPLIALTDQVYNRMNASAGLFFSTHYKESHRPLIYFGLAMHPGIRGQWLGQESGYSPVIHASATLGGKFDLAGEGWYVEPAAWLDYAEPNLVFPQLDIKLERERYYWMRLHSNLNSVALHIGYIIPLGDFADLRISAAGRLLFGKIASYTGLGMDGSIIYETPLPDWTY